MVEVEREVLEAKEGGENEVSEGLAVEAWERRRWTIRRLKELGGWQGEHEASHHQLALEGTKLGVPLLLAWQETSSAGTWARKLFHTVERKRRLKGFTLMKS